MPWLLLVIAGIFEIGWPLGFKLADTHPKYFYPFLLLAVLSMGISGWLLYLAQKNIPIGTAYAVWTGIGTVGTFLIGVLFFHDSTALLRILFVLLILTGVIGLKFIH